MAISVAGLWFVGASPVLADEDVDVIPVESVLAINGIVFADAEDLHLEGSETLATSEAPWSIPELEMTVPDAESPEYLESDEAFFEKPAITEESVSFTSVVESVADTLGFFLELPQETIDTRAGSILDLVHGQEPVFSVYTVTTWVMPLMATMTFEAEVVEMPTVVEDVPEMQYAAAPNTVQNFQRTATPLGMNLEVVPEPSTTLLGLLSFVCLATRRSRKS